MVKGRAGARLVVKWLRDLAGGTARRDYKYEKDERFFAEFISAPLAGAQKDR